MAGSKLSLSPLARALLRVPCNHLDLPLEEVRELHRRGFVFVMIPADPKHPGHWIDLTEKGARAKLRLLRDIEKAGGPDKVDLENLEGTMGALAGRRSGLTVSDIEQWIENDEGLYEWWKMVGGSKRDFIKKYRAELEEAIDAVTSGRKRAHYLQYDKPKKPPGGWSGLSSLGVRPEDEPEAALLAQLDVLVSRAERESRDRRRRSYAAQAVRAAGNLFLGVEEIIAQTGAKPSEELTNALRVLAERLKNAAGRAGIPMPPLVLYTFPKPMMHGLGALGDPQSVEESFWFSSGALRLHVEYRGKTVGATKKYPAGSWGFRVTAYLTNARGEVRGNYLDNYTIITAPNLGYAEAMRYAARKAVQQVVEAGVPLEETLLNTSAVVYRTEPPPDAHKLDALKGFGALGTGTPRMVSLKALLPQDALDAIERRHAAGLLTIRELKDICHKYATHLDAKGVDPNYLAYFIAHALGVSR